MRSAELPPLWGVIDTEALDGLFAPTRRGRPRTGHVGFADTGYEIAVDRDGDEMISVSFGSLE